MKATYSALNGVELAQAIAKRTVALALTIPGLNSRLVSFPRVETEITIRIKAYDREEATVTSLDEFVESLIDQGIEHVGPDPVRDETYQVRIDETQETTDAIRRSADLTVTRPGLTPDGRIVDQPVEANPLPAGENMDNIRQFGASGMPAPGTDTPYSGRGRVIEQETVGINGNSPIREKLKGDPAQSHFTVRRPS